MSKTYAYLLMGTTFLAGCRGDRPVFGTSNRLSETSEDGSPGMTANGDADVPKSAGSGDSSSTDGTEDDAPRSGEKSPLSCDEEGLVRCAPGGSAVEVCSAIGNWLVREQCTDQNDVCDRGECVECAPGETACDGESLRRCWDDGTWM